MGALSRVLSHAAVMRLELYGAGTHTWPYWHRELHNAWPMLTEALGI
jgi:S-formylglutathione hydrolase FrmB